MANWCDLSPDSVIDLEDQHQLEYCQPQLHSRATFATLKVRSCQRVGVAGFDFGGMPKRKNPFGVVAPIQLKVHVSAKHVASQEDMEEVYSE